MLTKIAILLLKILFSTSIGLLHAYVKSKKTTKNMRIFDNLQTATKTEILESMIAYAKAEITALSLPATTDVADYAVGFGEMWFIEYNDFAGINIGNVTSWVGSRPPHRPKTW